MKYIVTERQYKLLTENDDRILNIPFKVFDNDWNLLQKYLEKRGNPPYNLSGLLHFSNGSEIDTLGSIVSINGAFTLEDGLIKSLGDLTYVSKNLQLYGTKIPSLGKLTRVDGNLDLSSCVINSLGNLEYVGRYLDISRTNLASFENLKYVGKNLMLQDTPLSREYSESEIRQMVNVGGTVVLKW